MLRTQPSVQTSIQRISIRGRCRLPEQVDKRPLLRPCDMAMIVGQFCLYRGNQCAKVTHPLVLCIAANGECAAWGSR